VTEQRQIGRLTFRVEDDLMVARYALPDTMDGALFLGALALPIARVPRFKAVFVKMMQDALERILLDSAGVKPTWDGPKEKRN